MTLTPKTERMPDGRWKVSLEELPSVFYVADSEQGAADRMDRLIHALRSPNIQVKEVLPNGDVVLTLCRQGEAAPFLPIRGNGHEPRPWWEGQAVGLIHG
jgi:hypothetical protein